MPDKRRYPNANLRCALFGNKILRSAETCDDQVTVGGPRVGE